MNIIEWALMEDDILNVGGFEEVEIEVTLDSGAVDHVCNIECLPGYKVVAGERTRDFVGANGDLIKHHGEVTAKLEATDTRCGLDSTFQIADVSRCLYSVSRITRNGGKVEFKGDEARVYMDGKLITTFKERHGLYIGSMTLKSPIHGDARPSGFPRQGAKA